MKLLDYKLTLLNLGLVAINIGITTRNYLVGEERWWINAAVAIVILFLTVILYYLETEKIACKKRIYECDVQIARLIRDIKQTER
jgi:membrane protein YdbS with pleckstrin-like domain